MNAIIGVLAGLICAPSLAQSAPATDAQPVEALPSAVAGPAPMPGSIVMYRGSGVMGAAVACPIRYKGREIVELGRGKYAQWAVPSGRYILVNGTASVEVSVMPGETRYVRCQIKTGFLTGRADLEIVDEETFSAHRADYEEKPVSTPF